jgi:hypothetical protein
MPEHELSTATLTRRTLIRRAAIAGGAAWTAPVLVDSLASPAAASSCTSSTLNWNSITAGTGGTTKCSGSSSSTTPPCTTSSYTTPSVGGVTITFSVVAFSGTTLLSSSTNSGDGNLTVRGAPNGGITWQQALQLQMLPNSTSVGQTVTITFSKSVSQVSFALYDIDNSNGGWGDRVYTSPTPSSLSFTNAAWTPTTSHVTGACTSASPLSSTDTNSNYGDASSLGNATLTFNGPLTVITLTYYNAVNTGGSNQRIGIGPIKFCA